MGDPRDQRFQSQLSIHWTSWKHSLFLVSILYWLWILLFDWAECYIVGLHTQKMYTHTFCQQWLHHWSHRAPPSNPAEHSASAHRASYEHPTECSPMLGWMLGERSMETAQWAIVERSAGLLGEHARWRLMGLVVYTTLKKSRIYLLCNFLRYCVGSC